MHTRHGSRILVLLAGALLAPGCAELAEDSAPENHVDAVAESIESAAEAQDYEGPIDVTARIVCNHPGIDYMMVCSNAGTNCASKRPHPKNKSGGLGDLYACRTSTPLSCEYRYDNGDRCYFYQSPDFVLCRHTRL